MKEFRVAWSECPTSRNKQKVLFVKVADPTGKNDERRLKADAEKLATDHIERKHGITRFTIDSVKEADAVPQGSVTAK